MSLWTLCCHSATMLRRAGSLGQWSRSARIIMRNWRTAACRFRECVLPKRTLDIAARLECCSSPDWGAGKAKCRFAVQRHCAIKSLRAICPAVPPSVVYVGGVGPVLPGRRPDEQRFCLGLLNHVTPCHYLNHCDILSRITECKTIFRQRAFSRAAQR